MGTPRERLKGIIERNAEALANGWITPGVLATIITNEFPQITLTPRTESHDDNTGGMFWRSRTLWATEWEQEKP